MHFLEIQNWDFKISLWDDIITFVEFQPFFAMILLVSIGELKRFIKIWKPRRSNQIADNDCI